MYVQVCESGSYGGKVQSCRPARSFPKMTFLHTMDTEKENHKNMFSNSDWFPKKYCKILNPMSAQKKITNKSFCLRFPISGRNKHLYSRTMSLNCDFITRKTQLAVTFVYRLVAQRHPHLCGKKNFKRWRVALLSAAQLLNIWNFSSATIFEFMTYTFHRIYSDRTTM